MCICGYSSSALAAPPVMTHLYPAGGERGSAVEVTAFGSFGRWPVQAWVQGKGIEVQPGKTKGTLLVKIAADAAPGPRWLRLYDEDGASALRRFVIGTLPEVVEREPNDDYHKPQVLEDRRDKPGGSPAGPGVVVNGRLLKQGDVDCFAVRLTKGQTLVASVEAHRPLASPMDAVIQVVSERGIVLGQSNDYRGLDPQVVFHAQEDGTYVARIFAFPSVPDASVRFAGGDRFVYRLTLTTGGFADHAFPLAVPRARPGGVSLVGWNLPEAARSVPVAPAADGDEATVFAGDVAGIPTVRLEPHATQAYAPSGGGKPQEVTLPVTLSGRLETSGEVHAYRFQARKGQRLAFEIESARLGFPLDPVLRVTDAAGKTVAQGGGPGIGRTGRGGGRGRGAALGADPELTWTVPADGAYRVEVSDQSGGSGLRHLYRLRALLAEPDFTLSVAADQFAVAPGKTLDIPVTIDRKHDHAGPVELTVEGLPPGVTAEAVPGSGRSVTLRLRADAKATGRGPIRIVGRAKDRTAVARATLEEYGASTPQLWLSVSKTPVAPPPAKKKR